MEQAVLELIAERAQPFCVVRERLPRNFRGFAEANNACDIFRARTHTTLMVAAVKKLLQTRAAANVQRANALRSVEFMAGEGQQVEMELMDVDRNFPGGLHGIAMEINVGVFGDAADFFERLHRSEFVVGVHDGDERGFLANRAAQVFKVYQAVLVNVQVSNVNTLPFESLAGVQDGFVFHERRNHVGPRLWTVCGWGSDAEDGVIVRFGASACEEDFLGACSYKRGNLFARRLDGSSSLLAKGVDRGGVAEFAGEVGKHRVEHFWLDRGGGVVIEVDAVH